ncbi:RNA ligase [Aeromonas phage AhSzq-1]|uniref:RNA ligase n=1 Tax=Aeromonas phage AhSzq-1 TaxID=2138298 RepID=A0A2R4ALI9_9CAUD|nr:RNA ligase [Aeromonas phage AhSzq-1]AVR75919.1 RNA ligase [Aeromonas phage AhSzq-1]
MKATYEMAQRLVAEGLVKATECGDYTIYKYARKVFYKNLWTPELELFRGTVFRGEQLVVEPMVKVYNFGERNTGVGLPVDTEVILDYKVNGFMLNATVVKELGKHRLLFSTTGSLDSDFVALGLSKFFNTVPLRKVQELLEFPEFTTFTFEVVDRSDPHIVSETFGLHLLRVKTPEKVFSFEERNALARDMGLLHHKVVVTTLGWALGAATIAEHEGWMVYSAKGELLFKLKTDHYLTKKFLMRSSKASDLMFGKNPKEHFDEEFYGVIEVIRDNYSKEEWDNLDDQGRRAVIEDFFVNEGAF